MKGKLNKIFSVFMLTLIIGQISVPFASNVSLLADEISVVEKVNDNIITEENTSDEKVESETSFEETQSTENEEKVTEEQNAPPVTEEQNVPPVTDEVEVIDDVESLETAIEEDEEVAVTTNEIFSDYVDSDENTLEYVEVPNDRSVGNTYTVSKFAHPSITIDDYSATRFGQLMYYKIDGTIVFCIEPTKDVFSSATEQSESASSWSDLTSGNKREIGWIISYGLENYDESGNDDYLYATQLLIWDEIDPDKYDLSVQNSLTSDIETIQNDVSKHTIVPSFTSTSSTPTHTLTWNGSSYSKTLTDTNGVWDAKYAKYGTFGDYTLSDPTGANNVKVSTTNDNASTYNYTATYNPYNSGEARFFDANQDLVNVGADPVDSYMKFEIEPALGKIMISKTGESLNEVNNSNIPLSGVKFEIIDSSGKVVETVTTDTNGKVISSDLMLGNYQICEVDAPTGYILSSCKDVTVSPNETASVKIINDHIEGSMKLNKIGDRDYQSNETGVALDGVVFTLSQDVDYNGSYETTVETLETNVDGEIFAKNLDYGNYQVCETDSVEGYLNAGYCEKFEIRTQNQQVNVNGNEPIVNEVIIGGIHLTKNGENLDETNDSDVLLTGTEFMITGKTNPDYQETFVTDENGEISVNGLTYGIYTIEEVTPTVGYLSDGFEETFEIDQDGEVIEINNGEVINNNHIEGSMKLSKIGETVEDDDTWKTLKDVEFTLSQDTDSDGSYETEVGLYYTDNNGEIVIDNLDYGNYQIVETDTNQMYFNDGYTEEFIIVEDGVTVEINGGNPVYNYLIKGKIEINKAGENFDNTDETIYPLDGAEFTIYRDNPLMGTKDVKDIFDIAFQTVITDEVGYAQTSDLLVGTYFIEETKAPAGYILDETVHTVVLNEDTVAVNYDVYPINNGEKVINDVIMGQLEVYKNGQSNYVNEGKEYPLSEVEYSIYQDLNCNQVIDENESTPVDVIVTDDNGYAITTDLKYGNYIIKETNAPENYAIYEGQYYAAVTTDGEIIDITNGDPFVNHLEEAPINIVKTDDYGNPLVGVEFTVLNGDYTAEKLLNNETELGAGMISPMPMIPEVVGTYVTDENGEITTDLLPYGTYTVIETKGLGGYYVNIDFNVIEINDETVNDYEYLTLDIENKLYNPEIKIKKVDSAGNPLSGAEFAVYQDTNTDGVLDEEDTLVTEKFVSDSDGYVTFKFTEEFKMTDIYGTPYGYFVVETKAPVGYVLETEPQYVSFGYADYDGDYQPDEVILNPSVEEDDFTTYWLEPTEALVDEYEFENELIENEIHVKKTDMATGKEIAGAEIAVYDSEGELYESWTSTTQEHVFTAEYGNYTMCEEIAPEGYERLTQCVKFDVTEEGVIQYLEIENELIKNEVLITGNKVIYIIAGISVTISTIYIIKRKFLTN